jgi:hypothetical protein
MRENYRKRLVKFQSVYEKFETEVIENLQKVKEFIFDTFEELEFSEDTIPIVLHSTLEIYLRDSQIQEIIKKNDCEGVFIIDSPGKEKCFSREHMKIIRDRSNQIHEFVENKFTSLSIPAKMIVLNYIGIEQMDKMIQIILRGTDERAREFREFFGPPQPSNKILRNLQ